MKIRTHSWHCRFWMLLQDPKEISVCAYWSQVCLGMPLFWLFIAAWSPIWVPCYAIGKYLEKHPPKLLKKAIACPFGKIEFKD